MANPKGLLGAALHPEAQARPESKYEIVRDQARLDECTAALVYSPGEDWPEREDAQTLKAISCHAF